MQLVLSCEHAVNLVPDSYQKLFLDAEEDLNSHKGWDPGALPIATALGAYFGIQPFIYPFTRLLIEPNRSLDNSQLFSVYSNQLSKAEKTILTNQYYLPYRDKVESRIDELVQKGPVLHIGIHTFTPFWNEIKRDVDIGILFDPERSMELKYGNFFVQKLQEAAGKLKIMPNEPYQGKDDGFTTYLRTRFRNEDYMGFEIEVNQDLAFQKNFRMTLLSDAVKSLMSKSPIK